jgi:unsaturated rhamnogalacturonyl hydrolase
MVKNDAYEQGVVIPNDKQVFKEPYKMYLKEISVLNVKAPARELVTKEGDIIIATAKVGKGTVFAVGDPWLYNEYLDGRKLPAEYPNYKVAEDLVKWLLGQSKK